MKIGFCYDTKEDYGYNSNNLDYTDFASMQSISSIKNALENLGHSVDYVGNIQKLINTVENQHKHFDLVFNIAEGFKSRNRESLIPAYLEAKGIMYTGSDAFAMALTLNKHFTKVLVESIGIPVPKGFIFKEINDDILIKAQKLRFPLIIKPNAEGGSMGLKFIPDMKTLINESKQQINLYGHDILCEEYIDGKEITVPIIGTGDNSCALGAVAIQYKDYSDIQLYDAQLKYDGSELINISEWGCNPIIINKLKSDSIKIHQLFGIHDYSRMDFRMHSDGSYYFLETNLMPSLGRDGSFEFCAKKMGFNYENVIEWIIKSAIKRYQNKS